MLAIAHPPVLPSAMLNVVGTPVAIISQLNTPPACAPVNASMVASRLATHDSGSGWLATPFLYDSSIHYSTPVYPGALSSLLVLLCYKRNTPQKGQRASCRNRKCAMRIRRLAMDTGLCRSGRRRAPRPVGAREFRPG